MLIEPVVQIDPGADLQAAVATLIKVAENVEIVRWIKLPASVLRFLLVPAALDECNGRRRIGAWTRRSLLALHSEYWCP
jgi:hypothetical protein